MRWPCWRIPKRPGKMIESQTSLLDASYKALGLALDFAADPPTNATVPIVIRGYWSKERLEETFPISAIEAAEKNFENKSPSMLATTYGKVPVDLHTLVPSHLPDHQQEELFQLITKYKLVFDGDLGTLPGKPMELELKSPEVSPYHGRAYPVPKVHEKLVKEEVERLCQLKVLQRVNE
jgi:hypothetical protein